MKSTETSHLHFIPYPTSPEKKLPKPTSTGIRFILSFGNKKPTSQQKNEGKVGIKGGKTQLLGSVGSVLESLEVITA